MEISPIRINEITNAKWIVDITKLFKQVVSFIQKFVIHTERLTYNLFKKVISLYEYVISSIRIADITYRNCKKYQKRPFINHCRPGIYKNTIHSINQYFTYITCFNSFILKYYNPMNLIYCFVKNYNK